MGKYYEKAKDEDFELLNNIISTNDEYHDINTFKLKYNLLYAFPTTDDAGNIKSPAIKNKGVACAAMIKLIKGADKIIKNYDFEIFVDKSLWDEISISEKTAILEHELFHIKFKKDKNNDFKFDEYDRPMLQLKEHDLIFWGFSEIAKKHGDFSIEKKSIKEMIKYNSFLLE